MYLGKVWVSDNFLACATYLKESFRPQLISKKTCKVSEDVEIVRPQLTEASKLRWKMWVREAASNCKPKDTVTVTPKGKIITIEGGDSDSDSDDSCLNWFLKDSLCFRNKTFISDVFDFPYLYFYKFWL